MNELRIILDEDNFQTTQLSSISSGFHVQIDNFSFPNEEWTDLSVSILEMWLEVINSYLLYSQNNAVLNFMEGDYEIRLCRESDYCSVASFVEPNGNTSYFTILDSLCLARELLEVTSKVLSLLQKYTITYHIKKLNELTTNLSTTVYKLSQATNNLR